MDLAQKPVYKLDLAAGTSVVNLTTPLVEGDDRAQTFTLELTDKGTPANLNGYSVTAYFGRGKTAEAEADTIPLSGTVSGNVATITLTESCYSRSCYFSMPIRLSNGATGQKRTYLIVRGTVVKSVDGKIIDPDGSVPSLDDLFAQIAVMERSRQAAEEATEEALAAAARADETREGIQGDLAALTEEIDKVNNNLTTLDISKYHKVFVDGYINWDGSFSESPGWKTSDYIPVIGGEKIIAKIFASGIADHWNNLCGYDKDKNYVAALIHNTSGTEIAETITLPENVVYVRYLVNANDLANHPDFSLVYDNVMSLLTEAYKKVETETIWESEYCSVALFENIAVIGNSYSSGAVYGDGVGTQGRHNGMSWGKVMARRNGIDCTLYTQPGFTCKDWLEGNENYPALLPTMLADTPKNLYFIMMGINDNKDGSIADCNTDWTQNADTFYGNYGRIIGNIKQHAPSAKIVCILPPFGGKQDQPAFEGIREIANFYGVPAIASYDDAYFSSDFYTNSMVTSHPIGVTYCGMALAFERLFSKCVVENVAYFMDYNGNE